VWVGRSVRARRRQACGQGRGERGGAEQGEQRGGQEARPAARARLKARGCASPPGLDRTTAARGFPHVEDPNVDALGALLDLVGLRNLPPRGVLELVLCVLLGVSAIPPVARGRRGGAVEDLVLCGSGGRRGDESVPPRQRWDWMRGRVRGGAPHLLRRARAGRRPEPARRRPGRAARRGDLPGLTRSWIRLDTLHAQAAAPESWWHRR
jgi:hypothetical protein